MRELDIKRVRNAIFSDTTSEYVSPAEPKEGDTVTVSLRVLKKSVDSVDLVADSGIISMAKSHSKGEFTYYKASFVLKDEVFSYYFEIKSGENVYYYDARGLVEEVQNNYKFRIIPGFHTPDWAKGAVFYQIFVDRFYNGDETNDVVDGEYKYLDRLVYKNEWGANVCKDGGVGEFYGGDLEGVRQKLDYIKGLGVDVIYLNPIFVSPSNHKYDTADYEYVDPHFGVIKNEKGDVISERARGNTNATKFINRVTNMENLEASNEFFASFVKEAHEKGLKVILDGVFNHCGSFNKWIDVEKIYNKIPNCPKGAFVAEDSPYHDYFVFDGGSWPNNKQYKSWWDYPTLPKLNYECEELYNYILKIGAKWVSEPYCCDGWRLDVAADLGNNEAMNHKFWADFRKSVKDANPEAIILAEHYGDPAAWLDGNQWDTVMNYDAFMEPLTWFMTGMQKHSDEFIKEKLGDTSLFWDSMSKASASFTASSLQVAMNELSNHDHSRFLTRTTHLAGRYDKLGVEAASENASIPVMREAVAMQMTWPGAPTLYYGDEAGVAGFTDPDNRRCYPWGEEDTDLLEFHKEAIRLHHSRKELSTGSLIPLPTFNGTIAYARKLGKEVTIAVFNSLDVISEVRVPTWMIGLGEVKCKSLLTTSNSGWNTKSKTFKAKDGITRIPVGPSGAMILKVSPKLF